MSQLAWLCAHDGRNLETLRFELDQLGKWGSKLIALGSYETLRNSVELRLI